MRRRSPASSPAEAGFQSDSWRDLRDRAWGASWDGADRRDADFHGAKGAVLLGERLLVTLRDDVDWISFPGLWDLPGGGREGQETPRETFAREVREEVGLDLAAAGWLGARRYPSLTGLGRHSWFFIACLPAEAARAVALGDEGQGWTLMRPEAFVAMPGAVPGMQERLRDWLAPNSPETSGFPC